MGVVRSLSVVLNEYDDGCVIMSGDISTHLIKMDYYERYAPATAFARCLWALASWTSSVEAGCTDQEILWLQLQLPFDEPL